MISSDGSTESFFFFLLCLQPVGFYTIKPDITINERRGLWNHPPCLSFSQTGSIHSLSVSSKPLLRSERRARGARQSKENKLCVILRASNTCGMAVTDAPLITLLKFLMEFFFFFLCKTRNEISQCNTVTPPESKTVRRPHLNYILQWVASGQEGRRQTGSAPLALGSVLKHSMFALCNLTLLYTHRQHHEDNHFLGLGTFWMKMGEKKDNEVK